MSEAIKKKSIDKSLEYLRAFACLGVVLIHVFKLALDFYFDDLSSAQHIFYEAAVNNLRWCVPVFLMITGSLLLSPQKQITFEKLYKKYIFRILVVLFAFGYVFAFIELFFYERAIKAYMFFEALKMVICGRSWDHLWYLYMLVVLYMLLPIIKAFINAVNNNVLKYSLFIMILFISVIPMIRAVGFEFGFSMQVTSIYVFYPILGYCVYNRIISITNKTSVIMLVFSLGFLIGCSVVHYIYEIDIPEVLTSHGSFFVIIQSVAIFNIGYNNVRFKNRTAERICLNFAKLSFGIYIIHMFFLNLIYKLLQLSPAKYTELIFIPVYIITVALSYISTAIMKRIPVVNKFI